jgi:hypothetical protein
MKVEKVTTSILFEAEQLRQEHVVDALLFFAEKLKTLKVVPDALYPGDPVALPVAMLLSNRLSVPVKTEKFLTAGEKVLMIFSYLSGSEVTKGYLARKVRLFRRRFPLSPTLLTASSENSNLVDFQLLKVKRIERVDSYRFLSEAMKNYFYPLEGDFTHYTPAFWELAEKEMRTFEKAKRIRDSARMFLKEKESALTVVDTEPEIALWERFRKGILVNPEESDNGKAITVKFEKLIDTKDATTTSAVTSILEFISQSLERHFPVYLAYSGSEIVERNGVLIIPRVTETLNGADVRLEFVLRSQNLKGDLPRLVSSLVGAVKAIMSELFRGDAFRPAVDSVVDKELNKAVVYISWFLDKEMVESAYTRVNRRWLLSRLLYRKRMKTAVKDLLRYLKDFRFTPENLDYVFASLESVWRRNPVVLKLYRNELADVLSAKGLWGIVGVYGMKVWRSKSRFTLSLLSFLLSLKGYENIHHFFAEEDTYFVPVHTRRIHRPNWEKVIRENLDIHIKAEPLNPESPVTYTVLSQDGVFLGTIPQMVSHYISAKESAGKKIQCRKLYLDPNIFSDTSYWVEIKCL